jgi:hypothetical protein
MPLFFQECKAGRETAQQLDFWELLYPGKTAVELAIGRPLDIDELSRLTKNTAAAVLAVLAGARL